MPTWNQRSPFLTRHGRAQTQQRFAACASSMAGVFNIPTKNLMGAKLLGCGNYGCTYLVRGLPADRNVLKVTTDNLEAGIVNEFLQNDQPPDGIVRYYGIWRLGKCAALPSMRGAHRPAWLIQREELKDVLPQLQRQGVNRKKLEYVLDLLLKYTEKLYVTAGLEPRTDEFGEEPFYIFDEAPDYDDLEKELRAVRGLALLDAIHWLADRNIKFKDFQKVANLGWRTSTGLVFRDMGLANSEAENPPPATLDGLRAFGWFTRPV